MLVSALKITMLSLMRHVSVHWIHRGHLAKLIILLVECHCWVVVRVWEWNTHVLRHL